MSFSTPMGQLLARQTPLIEEGEWLVGPPLDEGLLAGPKLRVWTLDHLIAARWREQGHEVVEGLEPPQMARALLFWPKTMELGRWWLAQLNHHCTPGSALRIVGEHHGGGKRVPKELESRAMRCVKRDNARRCSLYESATVAGDMPDQWGEFEALGLRLISHPGVFGHGRLDDGTAMLIEALPALAGRVLDAGCGDGVLSAWLAQRGAEVTAVDINHLALEATRRTLAANGLEGEVLASNMLTEVEGRFDAIVSNPAFHQERHLSLDPARQLIEQAKNHLSADGVLYLVANGFLPYMAPLQRQFARVDVVAEDRRYRVYRASRR
ncbi:class I SAM-dependent methyltransferase [Kushneria aurantia]|uniref:Methyltransferase n=1 Tax=Kushneria aurantia TaxID=504092 RepID=A0ABV6G7A3_9GAMM|nr:class I SAM-dependent methyltransferase [Kushneria aurantia]